MQARPDLKYPDLSYPGKENIPIYNSSSNNIGNSILTGGYPQTYGHDKASGKEKICDVSTKKTDTSRNTERT